MAKAGEYRTRLKGILFIGERGCTMVNIFDEFDLEIDCFNAGEPYADREAFTADCREWVQNLEPGYIDELRFANGQQRARSPFIS